jgi:copper homeostasis protein
LKALDQLIALGFTRVLTSGQQRSAPEGIELIKQLIIRAGDKIEILPGGGIRPHNVRTIIAQTAANQVHLSAFGQRLDNSTHHRPQITFGGALHPPEDRYDLIDSSTIQSISDSLNP